MPFDKQPSDPDDALTRELNVSSGRFEAAWKSELSPRIEEFLASLSEEQHTDLLLELIRRDMGQRSSRGQSPTLDESTAQCSEHAASIREKLNSLLPVKQAGSHASPDPTTLSVLPAATTHELLSRQIGPYQILQELGEGGMGRCTWLINSSQCVGGLH
ncbi:MAG: hypothetical protein ABGZ35_31325 [Planctomycetaceae bacterium]|jgi:hypothetical protein